MEENLGCSGFCYTLLGNSTSFLQFVQTTKPTRRFQSKGVLQAGRVGGALAQVRAGHVSKTTKYPPTLFSKNNYHYACEAALVLELRYWVLEQATASYYLGISFLLISSVFCLALLCNIYGYSSHERLYKRLFSSARLPREARSLCVLFVFHHKFNHTVVTATDQHHTAHILSYTKMTSYMCSFRKICNGICPGSNSIGFSCCCFATQHPVLHIFFSRTLTGVLQCATTRRRALFGLPFSKSERYP